MVFCDSLLPNKTVVPAKFDYQLSLLPNAGILFLCVCARVCEHKAEVKVLLLKVAQSMQTQATD